jgi:guanylate kinase
VLEERLRKRDTESEEAIRSRLRIAEEELAYARQPNAHDLIVVNDNLEVAYEKFKTFILDVYNSKHAV